MDENSQWRGSHDSAQSSDQWADGEPTVDLSRIYAFRPLACVRYAKRPAYLFLLLVATDCVSGFGYRATVRWRRRAPRARGRITQCLVLNVKQL